jgi:uncharacterized membrane protein HdeD (DUF308 family)
VIPTVCYVLVAIAGLLVAVMAVAGSLVVVAALGVLLIAVGAAYVHVTHEKWRDIVRRADRHAR